MICVRSRLPGDGPFAMLRTCDTLPMSMSYTTRPSNNSQGTTTVARPTAGCPERRKPDHPSPRVTQPQLRVASSNSMTS
eukprot:2900343-Prymnesium_polylepis.1